MKKNGATEVANYLSPLIAGLLFGLGLVVSGMANPSNVLGFLALGPGWNPSLALVFCGALMVTIPGFFLLSKRDHPFGAASFVAPAKRPVDNRLMIGSAIFGFGWGLWGICPGPAVVNVGFLNGAALIFVLAFFLGGRFAIRVING